MMIALKDVKLEVLMRKEDTKNHVLPWLLPLIVTILLTVMGFMNGSLNLARSESREDIKDVRAMANSNRKEIADNKTKIAILETKIDFVVQVLSRTPEGKQVIRTQGLPDHE